MARGEVEAIMAAVVSWKSLMRAAAVRGRHMSSVTRKWWVQRETAGSAPGQSRVCERAKEVSLGGALGSGWRMMVCGGMDLPSDDRKAWARWKTMRAWLPSMTSDSGSEVARRARRSVRLGWWSKRSSAMRRGAASFDGGAGVRAARGRFRKRDIL